MPILKRGRKPKKASRSAGGSKPKPKPKIDYAIPGREQPEHPWRGFVCCQLGSLFPGTPFYFPDDHQFRTGLVIYHSIGSVYCRVRGVKPFSEIEFIDELPLASGACVNVKGEDYDAQKTKTVSAAALRREPGMEGFPEQ